MYDAELAEIYDQIYESRGKDYPAEVAEVERQIRARNPGANRLLDVACGTGSHLRCFRRSFGVVAGVERSADMISVATRRIPDIEVHQGDMRDFRLDAEFDAITCMFSSIGYLESTAELDRTLAAMATHLVPGGVVVIEPWVFPDAFIPGYVAGDFARDGARTMARISHSVRRGRRVPMSVHYLVADPTSGVRHFTDTHALTLFSRPEYEAAFTRAGCRVEYLPGGLFRLGLFVGVRK